MNAVRLHRVAPGLYEARVRRIDSNDLPCMLTIRGEFRESIAFRQWSVEGDENWCSFLTLGEAHAYINRFFEEA